MTAETRHEAAVTESDSHADVVLDVRPLIERGEEPFPTIMETVAGLDGRALVLVAPFEPTPLEGVLSAQGYTYESRQLSDSEWRVRFQPAASPTATPEAPSPFTIKRESSAPKPGVPPSVMAMNPTLNVPPAWLPLGFMAAAGTGLIGFGLALMVTAPTAVMYPRASHVIAAVHFGVLAFLSAAVLGALHQFGPVVGGLPLRSIKAGVITGVLFIPGAWIIPFGFATGRNGVIQIGGVLATTAVCIAAWNVSRPLSASGKGAPIVGLRLAVTYLVLTAAFGVTYAFDRQHFWFPLLSHRVLAHAHLGLLGWLGLAYVAVAEKLWPMFLLSHRPHAREGERAVWLVGAGAPLLTVGLLFAWAPVTLVGGLLVLAGLGFHLASLTSVIRHRRRNLELLHGFVLASAVCLVTAMVIGVIAAVVPLDPEIRGRLVAAEVLSLILWLTLAVLGHAHKIVPFISWNRLRDRGIMKGRDGRPLLFAHLVEPFVAKVTFLVAVAGAALGVVGLLSSVSVLVRSAGVLLASAGVLALVNLISGPIRMIRWHSRQQLDQSSGE